MRKYLTHAILLAALLICSNIALANMNVTLYSNLYHKMRAEPEGNGMGMKASVSCEHNKGKMTVCHGTIIEYSPHDGAKANFFTLPEPVSLSFCDFYWVYKDKKISFDESTSFCQIPYVYRITSSSCDSTTPGGCKIEILNGE